MTLIGLHGKKGAGKDEVFKILYSMWQKHALQYEPKRVAFADKMKLSVMRTLGFKGTDAEVLTLADRLKDRGVVEALIAPNPEKGYQSSMSVISGREVFQYGGTEGGRDIHGYNVWVDAALPLNGTEHIHDLIVVTDVRFPNEAERIHVLGGHVIEILRPGLKDDDSHASETPLPPEMIDGVIVNDGSLEVLGTRVREVLLNGIV